MDNQLQKAAMEAQQAFKQMTDRKLDLVSRGKSTLISKQDLTERWRTRRRIPHDIQSLYELQSKSFLTLAESYSAWLKANPEPPRSFWTDAASDLKSKSDEDKIAILQNIRDDRLRMLNTDLPQLEMIVKGLEEFIVAIEQTVNRDLL